MKAIQTKLQSLHDDFCIESDTHVNSSSQNVAFSSGVSELVCTKIQFFSINLLLMTIILYNIDKSICH